MATTNGIVYNTYGNLKNAAVTTVAGGETFTTATANTFATADTANWLVGLLSQNQRGWGGIIFSSWQLLTLKSANQYPVRPAGKVPCLF